MELKGYTVTATYNYKTNKSSTKEFSICEVGIALDPYMFEALDGDLNHNEALLDGLKMVIMGERKDIKKIFNMKIIKSEIDPNYDDIMSKRNDNKVTDSLDVSVMQKRAHDTMDEIDGLNNKFKLPQNLKEEIAKMKRLLLIADQVSSGDLQEVPEWAHKELKDTMFRGDLNMDIKDLDEMVSSMTNEISGDSKNISDFKNSITVESRVKAKNMFKDMFSTRAELLDYREFQNKVISKSTNNMVIGSVQICLESIDELLTEKQYM